MKLLLNSCLILGFIVTQNVADSAVGGYKCPHVLSYYLDYSYSMCQDFWDEEYNPDDEYCGSSPLGIYKCKCTDDAASSPCYRLQDQIHAMKSLTQVYDSLLKNQDYGVDAEASIYEWSDDLEVVNTTIPLGAVGTTISVNVSGECMGKTHLSNVYGQINETCNPYTAYIDVIFSDFHLNKTHIENDTVPGLKAQYKEIKERCPGAFILCFQIGDNPLNFEPTAMCDATVTAIDFPFIIDNPDTYAGEFLDYIKPYCEVIKHSIYTHTPAPTTTYAPIAAPYVTAKDLPVDVAGGDDGFWWWWILLIAIGVLLCCLCGAALRHKNNQGDGMDIGPPYCPPHEDDEAEVHDAVVMVHPC